MLVRAVSLARSLKRLGVIVAIVSTWVSCAEHDVKAEYYGKYAFSSSERRSIQRIADQAAIEVRRSLPGLPGRLVLRVQSGSDVMPETGQHASALPPDMVIWTVDASRAEGVQAIIDRQLRATLFHEFHHLVRTATRTPMTLMDHVVTEGMATAFERDFAPADPAWGRYPKNVRDWLDEMQSAPMEGVADRNAWLFRHPDGRRWIGYRVGTFLVDQAMTESRKSLPDLVTMPTEQVIDLALRRSP
jgi:hypothetical protein